MERKKNKKPSSPFEQHEGIDILPDDYLGGSWTVPPDKVKALMQGFYTVGSAAKKLGMERQSVYELLDTSLETIRLTDSFGDRVQILITVESVDAYAAWRKAKARKPAKAKPKKAIKSAA